MRKLARNILAFDTATAACSVALSVNGEIREQFEIAPQRHAEQILPMINQLLSEAGIRLNQLDAIAVGQGPGSFMGVRIAVGVAQGLAFGANLPVIPVSTLQALAQTAYLQTQRPDIIVAWDARMQAIYWGVYSVDNQQLMQPLCADALNAPNELNISVAKNWLFAGNAWQVYRQELTPVLNSSAEILTIYPHASAIIYLAEALYRAGQMRSPMELEPVYLRDQIAHLKNS